MLMTSCAFVRPQVDHGDRERQAESAGTGRTRRQDVHASRRRATNVAELRRLL